MGRESELGRVSPPVFNGPFESEPPQSLTWVSFTRKPFRAQTSQGIRGPKTFFRQTDSIETIRTSFVFCFSCMNEAFNHLYVHLFICTCMSLSRQTETLIRYYFSCILIVSHLIVIVLILIIHLYLLRFVTF